MTDREMLTVPLAHKIPAAEARRLGASEHRDYQPGEDITVPRKSAEMLAAAAQLQVNPHDREAVARLLHRAPAAESPASVPPPVSAPAQAPAPVAPTPAQAPAAAPVAASPASAPAPAAPAPATLSVGAAPAAQPQVPQAPRE